MTPPGEMLVAPETLADLKLAEGARPQANGGALLPPLRVQPQLVPGVLVVDIGIAQSLLKMPDQLSRLLIGKTKGKRAPLESVAGDRLRLVEPNAETDLERLTDSFHLNLTAFGLLSFFVGLFIVNSAIGLAFEQRLPMLRTLRACGVSARMLNAVLVIELVSLALVAGLIGLVCGYFIAAALLPDVAASLRGLYGAQIPGQLTLKPQWWIAGIAISVLGALAAAATSLTKALRLPLLATAQPHAWQQAQRRWLMFQSALALAVFAAAGGLLWFGDSLIAGFAVLAALMLGAALILPMMLEIVLSLGQRHARTPARRLVLGRQPPATVGIVAGADGAAARARGQCRRRHHGRKLQPHLSGLARRPAGGGRLCQRAERCAGDRDQGVAARAPRGRGHPARRPRRHATGGRADRGARPARSRHLSRPLAAAAIGRQCLEQAASRRCGSGQRTTGAASQSLGRRPHRSARAGRKLAARGGRHLRRLRQSEGPDRGQLRRADAALSGNPADAAWACGSRRRRSRR